MHKAKAFLFVSAGIFLLALAYHLGARSATAQAGGSTVVGGTDGYIFLANGDVYYNSGTNNLPRHWLYQENIFTGPPPATQATWGQVKARYRPGAAATPQDK
jgi:hypothetical protein